MAAAELILDALPAFSADRKAEDQQGPVLAQADLAWQREIQVHGRESVACRIVDLLPTKTDSYKREYSHNEAH